MVKAVPNPNIDILGGTSPHESSDARYKEYRRQWMENPRSFIVSDFPIHLDIEVTNRCNLKCTFCDKLPYLSQDQFGDIDMTLYKKIIDEGRERDLCSIKLSYRGEPLLHPRLAEMVAYAKRQGVIDIYFNTNAMLLSPKKAQELIEAGLDRISISIEGTDPEAFERERRGAKFYKIIENIDRLLEIRRKEGVSYPKVRIQTVALPGIDLDKYARFWAPHSDEIAAIDYKEVESRNAALIDNNWACPQLWQRMTIEWDGTAMPCNNDDFRYLSPGNVYRKSIEECWHDSLVQNARGLHKQGKSHLVKSCNGCHWRTTQIRKNDD